MWLRSTLPLLRSQRSSDVGALRRRLKQLRSSNRRAHTVLRERRRMEEAGGSSSATSEQRLRLLPVNEALESSIAFALSENRDARAELELTRHLLNSSLLSMASPVGVFDPYDVKPQTFALDNYLALPVFTSLKYLRAFCSKFGYATRDPRGVLWADGKGDGEGSTAVHLLPAGLTDHDMWRASAYNPASPTPQECGNATDIGEKDVEMKESSTISPTDEMDAESLFAELNGEESTPSHKRKRPRRRKTPNRRRRVHPSPSSSEPSSSRTSTSADRRVLEEEAKRRFWSRVMTVPQFGVTQATPLPMFGPFTRAFFVGYFADINTLLHNASIIPKKVDIILNPASPLEFVLAREVTDCVLQREPLLFKAYKKVERELQREFATFFLSACPEVRRARSACIPGPLNFDAATAAMKAAHTGVSSNSRNPLHTYRQRTRMLREAEYSLGQTYTLVVILESDDLSSTFVRIQEAKRQCALMGHRDLDVLPLEAAAPHVVEASSVFYDRSAEQQHTQNLSHDDSATTVRRSVNGHSLGIFTQRGSSVTVNVAQPAESFYHDPTNAYTEAHAVFTEELNSRRR